MENYYILDITPQTSPRPRIGRFGAYMPSKYKNYQDCMILEMNKCNIVKDDYKELELIAYFPYSKSPIEFGKTIPKKERVEGRAMRKTPDYDNTAKTITDCLEKIGIIENDKQIYKATITKLYTTNKEGRIEFKLKL